MSIFSTEFEVRDYECDLQGIVNNAVYQNYLEHGRHKFLESIGVDFAKVTLEGINLVVMRAELDYKKSLKSHDSFKVETSISKEGRLKFCFNQKIIDSNGDLVLKAKIFGVALNTKGRPFIFESLEVAASKSI